MNKLKHMPTGKDVDIETVGFLLPNISASLLERGECKQT